MSRVSFQTSKYTSAYSQNAGDARHTNSGYHISVDATLEPSGPIIELFGPFWVESPSP